MVLKKKMFFIKKKKCFFGFASLTTVPPTPIGILLPGIELLDSPIRTEFSTGSFRAVFIWLYTKFSTDRGVQQEWHHIYCDVTAVVTGLSANDSNLVHC